MGIQVSRGVCRRCVGRRKDPEHDGLCGECCDAIVVELPGMRLTNPLNGSFGTTKGAAMARAKARKTQRYAARLAVTAKLAREKLYVWNPAAGRPEARLDVVSPPSDGRIQFQFVSAKAPPISVHITRIATRKLDSDNLAASAKAVRDGIADALGVDDGDETRVVWTYAQETARTYGVRIEIGRIG